MKTVAIICGGKSSEHQVSLQSGVSVYRHLDKELYDVVLIGIRKNGEWCLGSPLILNEADPQLISLSTSAREIQFQKGCIDEKKIDVVFSVLHGNLGEDGCMQGFFKVHGVPFVGPGVLGSAIAMDKDVSKSFFRLSGIRCAKSITLYSNQKIPDYEEIVQKLGNIVFIKPCNMGSSIGVFKCNSNASYHSNILKAFTYDRKILIEEYVECREIEISVLGNQTPETSVPGEIFPADEFYSYEDKYIDGKTKLEIPANLDKDLTEQMQKTAVKAFQLLQCEGLSRVDFFLKEGGRFYLNEINTLPGFTKISMYPKLWEASGLSFEKLIDKLIILAFERYEREESQNISLS